VALVGAGFSREGKSAVEWRKLSGMWARRSLQDGFAAWYSGRFGSRRPGQFAMSQQYKRLRAGTAQS